MGVPERLQKLRALMAEKNIDMYVVPTADFHQSEYVGEHFKAREYITNFSGSAGTAVITKDAAGLWTDGRYFLQAAIELEGTTVDLFKMGEAGVPSVEEYVANELAEGATLGFDGRVFSMGEGQEFAAIAAANNAKVNYTEDLINDIWEDRPALSEEPVFALGLEYTGETVDSKIARVREVMTAEGANAHIITSIDDVCWLLNIRGNDIEFFPLVLSYAIVTMDAVELYINEQKLSDEIKADLAKAGVVLRPYNDVYEEVKRFTAEDTLLVDPARMNYAIFNNIASDVKKVEKMNPTVVFKAMKNPVEVENMKIAQIKDSVAHVRFMYWLKHNYNKETITEMSAAAKLDEFRKEMGNFISPSFEPISSFGEHAAIIHYTSTPETDVKLEEGGFYLSDTGAGFIEGSTDITRTYALGEVSPIMKDHFTATIQSNLGLAHAKFLHGANGVNLDILTRAPYWNLDLNYNHGTGHGVGYLMNIHEAPTGIRWQYRPSDSYPFEDGMIITDEPGIYIEGSHGVRLENEILVRKGVKNEYGQFMYFEIITFIPFDLDAVNVDMLLPHEKQWLNDYHKDVYDKVSPYLEGDEKEWLKEYTRAI